VKKMLKFLFVIAVIVIAAALVMGATYPEVQESLDAGAQSFGDRLGAFADGLARSFADAFSKGSA
jgi:hypothetical protein